MDTATAILIIVGFIALIIMGPIAAIWALNTVFSLSIAYTFKTWAAMLILELIMAPKNWQSKEK